MLKPFNLDEMFIRVAKAADRRYLSLQVRDYKNNLEKKVEEQAKALHELMVKPESTDARRSALDSDKWGRWRPLVGVGGADGGPGQRRWGGVGGTACKGRQSRTGPVRLCGVVE